MKRTTIFSMLWVGSALALSGCATQPPTQPVVIYAEPVFDKFGNPSCRPADVPIGGAYTQELPLCAVIGGATPVTGIYVPDTDGMTSDGQAATGTVTDTGDTDPGDTDPGDDDTQGDGQNQNQNNNQNRNQNQNTNG